MENFSFHGLGTEWSVLVDAPHFSSQEKKAVLDFTERFEKRFSRFLPTSEANAFRESQPGQYEISEEFFLLLERADRLRQLTHGAFDPAVSILLERAGYGTTLGQHPPHGRVEDFVLPRWTLSDRTLVLDGPIAFDLGGMGKGYCIDRISEIIKDFGYEYFLVEGGGDMYGTRKSDGNPWQVALEYPGKPELAACVLELQNQGLAVSDQSRRRFGKWHHIVDWKEKKSRDTLLGCAALAPSAWAADCVTSGLFLTGKEDYLSLAKEFNAEYIVFYPDGTAFFSSYWEKKLFV